MKIAYTPETKSDIEQRALMATERTKFIALILQRTAGVDSREIGLVFLRQALELMDDRLLRSALIRVLQDP